MCVIFLQCQHGIVFFCVVLCFDLLFLILNCFAVLCVDVFVLLLRVVVCCCVLF